MKKYETSSEGPAVPSSRSSCAGPPSPSRWSSSWRPNASSSSVSGRASPTHVRQHREHAAVVFGGLGQAELLEDAGDVLFDRPFGHHQAVGDAGVGAAFG